MLYSGQARTVKDVWANHVFWLQRQFPNPTIVASVADDAQAEDMRLLAQDGIPFFMEKHVQPTIEEPTPRCRWHAGYGPSSSNQAILRQLWSLSRTWDYAASVVNLDDYDIFVRVRPDLTFLRVELPKLTGDPEQCLCVRWSKWGGVNDRFGIFGRMAAKIYFRCFKDRDDLWDEFCPLHPETMLGYQMKRHGIKVDDSLRVEYVTVRLPDEKHPDGSWQMRCDITGVDLLDAADRP